MAGSRLGTVFVELELSDKVYKQKLSEIQPNAVATAKGVETAWKQLGTRSEAVFDAQRRSAENAYTLIKNSASSTANDIIRAEEAKNAKIKALTEQQYGHQVTLQDKLQKNWLSVTTAIAAAYGALAGGKQLIDAALAMDRINYAMASSVGDADKAAREYQYVREEAQRLGLGLNETALAYSKFAASARGTSLEGEQTRKVFSSVAEAATALRLPADQASGIFLALSQMMSKGKVQAEELRGQLGERLPGAFNLAAQAMGVTTAELDEMLKKGEVTASDMLPKLAVVLHETYGVAAAEAAQGGQAAINRFNNEMFLTKVVMGESILPVFTDFLGIVQKTTPYITAFIGGIKMSAVEVFGWIDKVDAVLTHASKYTDPTQWGIISTSDLKKRLKEIDGNVEKTKKDIVENIDKVKSSSISAADKAAQAVINAERKKREASTKASDASTKAAEAAAKRQEAAEKQLAQELEKTIADRKKYEGTYYEWKAAEIELGLNKYREAGVSEEEIAKLRKEKLINLNAEIYEQYKKTLKDWDADTKKKHADMLAAEEKAEKEEVERAERQRAALKDLYKDLGGYSGEYYAVETALLDSRAAAYEKLLIDEKTSEEDAAKYRVAIAKWRENELVKIDIDQGKRSDDFFAGLNAHILEIEKNQIRWGQVGYETFASMTAGMSSTFSTVFEDAYKGQLQSIGDYSTMIWDKVRAKYFDMVAQMIAEKIVLSFATTWAEGGAAVLSTINKVLGLADSLDLGQYVGVNFAQGGIVQGVAAYPGNDERNDRVPAWLSPGEYIIPRTAVNADTREILDYIRSFGKAPGYSKGGWVTESEWPYYRHWQPGDEMEWVYSASYPDGPFVSYKIPGPYDVAVTNPWHMRLMQTPDDPYRLGNETPYEVFAMNVAMGKYPAGYYRIDYQRPGNVDSWTYQVADNKIVGSRLAQWGTGLKGDSGGGLGGFFGAINETLGPLVPVVGQAAGYAIANAALPILGPAALSGLVTYGVTDNIGAAIKTAVISAASAYIVQYAKEALSGVMDTSQWSPSLGGHGSPEEYFAAGTTAESLSTVFDAMSKIATESEMETFIKSLGKDILKYSLKGLTGSIPVGFNLAGISGLENLSMLADLNGIIGMHGTIPSARSGIDYIPRDNLIVRTHEGEAVITKEENRQRLSGRGGGAQMINVRVFIGDTELRSLVRVEADGVIVARNSRGVNSSMRVYQ